MNKITFENIYAAGYIIDENNHYKHVHYPEMLVRYDSNFIEFKTMPTINEFKKAATYLRGFHLQKGQKHVKFYFPANEKPSTMLMEYFKELEYEVGYLELYAIKPNEFPNVIASQDVEVQVVTEGNLDTFLELQYQQDLQFGEEFAKQKVDMHKRNFDDPKLLQIMAYYTGIPAGSVDIIIADNTAEIDGLTVLDAYQRKGIGSRLQRSVMDKFPDKTIILVADGEDTPRNMYRRQGYQYLGFKYEVQKVYHE